jgi:hypothetical protein
LAARYPDDCFVWIDIETHADRLGEDIDIENFPTVLIQPIAGGAPHFYGTVLPHLEVLDRMLARGSGDAGNGVGDSSSADWLLGPPARLSRSGAAWHQLARRRNRAYYWRLKAQACCLHSLREFQEARLPLRSGATRTR